MKHLTVFFDDTLVGRLAEGESGGLFFTYTHDWLLFEFATPLSPDIPLSDQTFHGDPVMSFFENLFNRAMFSCKNKLALNSFVSILFSILL